MIDKPVNYPYNILPTNVKAIIHDLLVLVGPANVQYFFDQTLTTLAVDLSNNVDCIGHNVLLQLIAFEWPTVCVQNLAKNAILRNSYQNRSSIGLNILWALGQGGYRDPTVGVRVWQNIMVPVLEMKSYTKWVCEYVHRMLNTSVGTISLVQNEFFTIFDELVSQRNGLPKDCQKLLSSSANAFLVSRLSSILNSNWHHSLYLPVEVHIERTETPQCLFDIVQKTERPENDCFRTSAYRMLSQREWMLQGVANALPEKYRRKQNSVVVFR